MNREQHNFNDIGKFIVSLIGTYLTIYTINDSLTSVTLDKCMIFLSILCVQALGYYFWARHNSYFMPLLTLPVFVFAWEIVGFPLVVLYPWVVILPIWRQLIGDIFERVYFINRLTITIFLLNLVITSVFNFEPQWHNSWYGDLLLCFSLTSVYMLIGAISYTINFTKLVSIQKVCKVDVKLAWNAFVLSLLSANVANTLSMGQYLYSLLLVLISLPIYIIYLYEVKLFDFERYVDSIFVSVYEGIIILSAEGDITSHNKQALTLLELNGINEIFQKYTILEKITQIQQKQQKEPLNYCITTPSDKKVEVILTPIHNVKGYLEGAVCVLEDISYKVLWEENAFKKEKVALVGQLAAGFAHEIKNPLTSMKGFFQLLKSSSETRDIQSEKAYTENILSEIETVNLIVSEFLSLAKPKSGRLAFTDINYVFKDIWAWIESEALLYNVEVRLNIAEELPMLVVNTDEIKQALLHVISNAFKAMNKGGILNIKVQKNSDGKLFIYINDTGSGMSKEVLGKVFEPFYSTSQHRIGLGLTVTKEILEKHNGDIFIDSNEGRGTSVKLMLPTKC